MRHFDEISSYMFYHSLGLYQNPSFIQLIITSMCPPQPSGGVNNSTRTHQLNTASCVERRGERDSRYPATTSEAYLHHPCESFNKYPRRQPSPASVLRPILLLRLCTHLHIQRLILLLHDIYHGASHLCKFSHTL